METESVDYSPYYAVHCPECGWNGSSEHCAGGGAIADTGEYSEIVCPECFKGEKWIMVNDGSNIQDNSAAL
jgi:hypothetical protein